MRLRITVSPAALVLAVSAFVGAPAAIAEGAGADAPRVMAAVGPEAAADPAARLRASAESGRPAAVVALARHLLSTGRAADVEEALALLEPLADGGDAGALETLGRFHLAGGPGHPADGARARDFLTRAAAAGSTGAGVRLGEALVRGEAGLHDPQAGAAMLAALAEAGNPWAPTSLGKLLLSGAPGLPADVDRALGLLDGPAAAGNASALEALGRFHLTGAPGHPADGERARGYLERAIAAGSGPARLHLARALLRREAGLADPEAGLRMLEEAVAAGDAKAAVALGLFALEGAPGLPADPGRAVQLLGPAAEAGDPEALDALGRLYLTGAEGVPNDASVARDYLERAAEAGRVPAALRLADALINGEAGLGEPDRGVAILERAATAGDTRAMIMLAEALLDGAPGLPRDGARARALMEQAIEAGDARAPVRLAQLLLRGGAMERDPSTAERLLLDAAAAGDARAAVTLGNLYLFGAPGVARDPSRSLGFLEAAADAGDASAWTLIGRGHVLGRFGPPDAERALAAFERARGLGDKRAAVLMAETRIFGWAKARKDVAAGLALLESEAGTGNAEALRTLIRYARDGIRDVRRPDPAAVDGLIDAYERVAGRDAAALERLLAAAARARSAEDYGGVRDRLKALPANRQMATLGPILAVNENLAVFLMQDALIAAGRFDGRPTGRLDRATVRAVMSACVATAARSDCQAPLTPSVLQAVYRHGWAG